MFETAPLRVRRQPQSCPRALELWAARLIRTAAALKPSEDFGGMKLPEGHCSEEQLNTLPQARNAPRRVVASC